MPSKKKARPPVGRLKRALAYVTHSIESLKQRRRRLKHRITARRPKGTAIDKFTGSLVKEINRCVGLGLTYSWGGGHITPSPANGPWDCSSYASHLAQFLVNGVTTGTTYTMVAPGPGLAKGAGKLLTFFVKNDPGNVDAHVICRVTNPKTGKVIGWTQCGGRDNTKAGRGPCWFTPTAARIAEFTDQVHPKGM